MQQLTSLLKLPFNPAPSYIMHLDLNSCFASIEQQANPHLRGKPVAVAAYATKNGCILAPSVEAKRFGVKTGMRVRDGLALCPSLIVLPPDPWKYRDVHLSFRQLFGEYTNDVLPKSIDEFVLDLKGYPACGNGMEQVALELKDRVKKEIGEWLTVSVGIAPNRYLAKTGAGLNKPDGLDEINKNNFKKIYRNLKLTDLCGIKLANAVRLNRMGISTVLDFYEAPFWKLKSAFASINGYYWYARLRGWEVDNIAFGRKSYGNSYALPKPFSAIWRLTPILQKLVEKAGARMRRAGYKARGVHLAISYRDRTFWHRGMALSELIFDSRDIYKYAFRLLLSAPEQKPAANLAVSCFNLAKIKEPQLTLFEDLLKKEKLVRAVDRVNNHWGNFVITPARMLGTGGYIPDRISFGGVKELEEFTFQT
ncbi:MAG: Uncharacterized protein G01um10145_713 [Microgenomates group bacterium Gr01-1014_5]|nr:MAG: Uncharacterized protein G01um10145_713 [Microgenomates group bacterium Gr01-1014_5]